MADRLTVSSLIKEKQRNPGAFERSRRRSALRERTLLPDSDRLEGHRGSGYEAVQQTLKDILRSACDVIGANQAFILVSRSNTALEVASSHNICPSEVMCGVLSQATQPVQAALREKIMVAGDLKGSLMTMHDGADEQVAPAVLCLPLDLGPQLNGVLCLLRRQQPRRLSDLDLEIVQALAEQAALAVGAASHSRALSRLQASLTSFTPAYA